MIDATQFEVPDDGSFYITVSETVTVYETYDAAIDEIQEKLDEDDDAFVAELSIDGNGEDFEANFDQVEWPKIIRDMKSDD